MLKNCVNNYHHPLLLLFTADMISEEVMKIFTNCAKFYGEDFDTDNVASG